MSTESAVPIYAQWDGQELVVDRPTEPEVGQVVRIEVEDGCNVQRRPFRVVGKHDRLEGDDGAARKVAVDLDVEPIGF
jgi:hypothetical protein